MKTILAPIDFSPATRDVIAAASALARSFDGRVVLLNVTEPPMIFTDQDGTMIDFDDLTERTARTALVQLERLRDHMENDFVRADVVQLTGSPVALMVEQAGKLAADYIVMGSHGHTALHDLVMGSTTADVIERAPCPVMIVPPAKKVATRRPKSVLEPALS